MTRRGDGRWRSAGGLRRGHGRRVPQRAAVRRSRAAVTGHVGRCARLSIEDAAHHVRSTLRRPRDQDPAVAARIPPGQYKTDKFPVLHYGSVPHIDLATWDFRVWGEVDSPFTLTWDQFKELPRKTVNTDIHCVTRWSKLDTTWEGVPIQTILEMAGVRPTRDPRRVARGAGLHRQRAAVGPR